jgi:ribonuclease BN (tRNA processing enzyme)
LRIATVAPVVSVRLTILGKSPSWQDRDGACTGYLAEVGDAALLIDCGNGVFAKLRRYGAYERIAAVVISHFHADHVLDLVPFAHALRYGPLRRSSRPQLHVPPGTRAALRRMCGSWGSETVIEDAFDVSEYEPAAELELGTARLRFRPLPHYVTSHAIEVRAAGSERRLVVGGDCGPNEELAEFARGAELLVIEATLLEADASPASDEGPGHLSAAQAGSIGRAAAVERLLLTHFSDQLDHDELRARAEAAFGRAVELAVEGAVHQI